MIAHLPALQVVIPLFAAPLCVLLRKGMLPWLITLAVSWVALLIAGVQLADVLDGGPVSYALGGFAAPFGIEYRVDVLNAFMMLIVAGMAAVILPFARKSVAAEIREDQHFLFYAAFLLMLTGLLGMAITGDAFNLFVFIEISALSSYALIAMGKNRRALRAAFTYLVMGTAGATFILIGIGLLYVVTGTLNMADLAERLQPVNESRTVLVAFAFLAVGISLKLALFPLHMWLPNAYTYAPSVVTAFLAATATKVAIYVLLRFIFTIFGVEFSFGALPLGEILLVLAITSIVIASTVAIFQKNIKRMLAYSSLAQIGYIILGISYANVTGLSAAIMHLFNHAATKGALFLILGCVVYRTGSAHIDKLQGLGRRMPLTMFGFAIAGLSLIGVPLTAGFISKWYLVLGAMERGWWPAAVVVLSTSLLAVAYIWKVVEVAYFRPLPEDAGDLADPPLSMLIPAWVLILSTIYFGIETSLPVGVAEQAARFLFENSP
ncbi:MAG: monovalent cation/H+ antiporter subunit D family protein [Proteobacteria bacterium]|nr:monovalent cation/H+ antiporter subunit D family protein [Pseudomonadota bacterium]